jgi:hypothetical protein
MTTPQVTDKPADAAPQPRDVAPTNTVPRKRTPAKKAACKPKKTAKPTQPKKAAKRKAAAPAKSKSAIILSLLGRANGTTLATIMAATGGRLTQYEVHFPGA